MISPSEKLLINHNFNLLREKVQQRFGEIQSPERREKLLRVFDKIMAEENLVNGLFNLIPDQAHSLPTVQSVENFTTDTINEIESI